MKSKIQTYGKSELVKELEEMRKKITKIYMDLGNPEWLKADTVLSEEITKIEEYVNQDKNVVQS